MKEDAEFIRVGFVEENLRKTQPRCARSGAPYRMSSGKEAA
jgi:hypothetical protein